MMKGNIVVSASIPGHILLALDGSVASDLAAPFARDLAVRAKIPVLVLHVFSSIRPLREAAIEEIEWTEGAEPRAVIAPPSSIRESVELLQSRGVEVEVVGRIGSVAEQIREELALLKSPWVVMSSLGSGGIRQLFLGSTTLEVVHQSRHPVLLVPSTRTTSKGFGENLSCVALFLDGSQESELALAAACGASRILSAELELVRVAETFDDETPDHQGPIDPWISSLHDNVEQYLDRVQRECKVAGVRSRCVTLSGNPATQLPRYVQERTPDLTVLATKQRSGMERWTYGSFAEKMSNALPVPMLLVPVHHKTGEDSVSR